MSNIRGILREVWYDAKFDATQREVYKENSVFSQVPNASHVIRDFDAPTNIGDNYVQRLSGYFQVCFLGDLM